MNVKFVAGQPGKRRTRFALSCHSARPAAGNADNVIAPAFVVLVVVGSLLIMADLNDNMQPATELMNLQMQH